ncbi:pirin family protein [Flexibacterium corallicola]|uniref:pirin family protein n=1 Tax=Flexibacterium corallicola TaxID=3037259 RepID=UPI00286F1A1D|nr:pirin family protein [Pseudovibrio sp. M1P-2-3]
MNTSEIRIIHREDLPLGGFAGIVETRMVMNPNLWASAKNRTDISHGLGDFIYLANGYFKADDGAPMHPHADVDIVSFIPKGAVGHEGSMGHGTTITGPGIQVQRAGTGIEHAEFSLNGEPADLVQMWFNPPKKGLTPAYQDFKLDKNKLTTVLGGNSSETFDNTMTCKVGYLSENEILRLENPFIVLITEGTARANGQNVKAGDLIEGEALEISSQDGFGLVVIQFTANS